MVNMPETTTVLTRTKFDEDFDLHWNAAQTKLTAFLKDKEPDTLIIKGHLLCEYYFNQLLVLYSEVNISDYENKSWTEKKEKLFSLKCINENINRKLGKLNKLRNVLGHELEYVLTESDIDALGFLFGKEYIIDKYKITDKKKLLERYVSKLVVDIAMILLQLTHKLSEAPKLSNSTKN